MSNAPAENPEHAALAAALRRALRPLVRLFLRSGLPFKAFAAIAKEVFVESAARDFPVDGRRTTDARISVMTGLTRKDVRRLRREGPEPTAEATVGFNRAARVTTAWLREKRYHDDSGAPRALPFDGRGASFTDLVRRHSGDMPPRAVLAELLRVGAVVEDADGAVRLAERGYVPRGDTVAKLGILGEDVHTLAATIEHNIAALPEEAWFQRHVSYDSLPASALAQLRTSAARRGQKLLETLDTEIARHDLDLHPDKAGAETGGAPGRKKIVVGVYYWEGDSDDEETED